MCIDVQYLVHIDLQHPVYIFDVTSKRWRQVVEVVLGVVLGVV